MKSTARLEQVKTAVEEVKRTRRRQPAWAAPVHANDGASREREMTEVTQMRHVVYQVPDVPVSLNVLLRMHWSRRRKYNEAWAWSIRAAIASQGAVGDLPLERARVLIIQHRKRKLDRDNLVGSCKPILDGLKQANVIVDDDEDHCRLSVCQSGGWEGTGIKTLIEIRCW